MKAKSPEDVDLIIRKLKAVEAAVLKMKRKDEDRE